MADPVVLDTSACFAFLENEAGADEVEAYLREAQRGVLPLRASFVTLTELEYIITQEQGPDRAHSALAKAKAWPITWHHSDEVLCGEAARLKAAHKISFADAFVAATAKLLGATLVHKDPEFNALAAVVKPHTLPSKGGAGALPTR